MRRETQAYPASSTSSGERHIIAEQREKDSDALARLLAFRKLVSDPNSGHLAQYFSGPHELAAEVAADLHHWVFDKVLAERLQAAAHDGEFGLIRQISELTNDESRLRAALAARGLPHAGSLLDSLLTLAGPAVLKRLLQGFDSLGNEYTERIQNFLDSYLGTLDQPTIFGGRDRELRQLEEWLDSADAERYLLLAGSAGSGKSALLAHWSRRLLGRNDCSVIIVPISSRFRINRAAVVFPIIAARLAEIHGEHLMPRSDMTAEA